ncbi:hypothetical protein KY290_011108 [Solanum tuberosum]|uniref:Uncharacterized protein n=1 Tax=Solanum tuberosum TaxID=4113 RepID=A0ABQ7W0X4_SOLTU|nr:hypothetical protein KY290_011108 [Solanum tuberosum]
MLKTAGGLGFVDITDWNRTAISEHFWNLCLKKDMLWIQLVHAYYIKGGSVWDLNNSRASCTIKEILNAKRTLEIAGYKKQDVTLRTKFSTKVVYCKLGGDYTKNSLMARTQRSSLEWKDKVMWAIAHAKGNSVQAALYRLSITCCLYLVWHERNLRLHQMRSRSPEILIRLAAQAIHCKGSLFDRLHSRLPMLNYYP